MRRIVVSCSRRHGLWLPASAQQTAEAAWAAVGIYFAPRIPVLRPQAAAPAGPPVRRRLRRPADPDLVVRLVAARDHQRPEPARHPSRLGAERGRPRLGEHGAGALGRLRAADRAARPGRLLRHRGRGDAGRARAWAAFLLCRHLTGRFWPSLVGGYLFGFSSYELGHVLGQPQLTAVFAVPLIALVVVRAARGRASRPAASSSSSACCSRSRSTSRPRSPSRLTIALVLALALGFLLAPPRRPAIRRLLGPARWAPTSSRPSWPRPSSTTRSPTCASRASRRPRPTRPTC